jgi:hypothetical protein
MMTFTYIFPAFGSVLIEESYSVLIELRTEATRYLHDIAILVYWIFINQIWTVFDNLLCSAT